MLLVTYLFITLIVVVPSDGVVQQTALCEWQKPTRKSSQTLSSSNQQNQVCFSCKCIFAHSISKHHVCISLALSLPFRDLFAAYLEAMAWKVYCGGELKGSLITFYWCGQIIKTNRATEKKSSQPLMELLDICDFPLSDDTSWKFWPSGAVVVNPGGGGTLKEVTRSFLGIAKWLYRTNKILW